MPPVQPSLRGSLLTGASALALSVSASGAHAQSVGSTQKPPPALTFWVEGALFETAGGNFNVPALPGLTAPYTSFNPQSGYEGAVGFDYRWPNQAWHFVFDFRYGRSKSSTANSSGFHSSIVPTFAFGSPGTFRNTSVTSSQSTEREDHLVADFMIGRELGVGSSAPELLLGIRVADLWATAHIAESGQGTFYSSPAFGVVTAGQSATGDWNSRFFGAGPRVAATGSVPIIGFWTFDYSGGIAALLATRQFSGSVSNTSGANYYISQDSTALVFNADASIALSYLFTPNLKVSSGVRGDYYNSALTTYNINTGAYQNIDRLFWGPFIRLTGTFW